MKRTSRARDVVGTALTFIGLILFTCLLIYGENLLEAFKSH